MKLSEKLIKEKIDHAHSEINTIIRFAKEVEEAERLMEHLWLQGGEERGVSVRADGQVVIYYHEDARALFQDIDAAALRVVHICNHGTISKAIHLHGCNPILQVDTDALESLMRSDVVPS